MASVRHPSWPCSIFAICLAIRVAAMISSPSSFCKANCFNELSSTTFIIDVELFLFFLFFALPPWPFTSHREILPRRPKIAKRPQIVHRKHLLHTSLALMFSVVSNILPFLQPQKTPRRLQSRPSPRRARLRKIRLSRGAFSTVR